MRYYEFSLKGNVEQIEKNTKIRLRDYGYYTTPVSAVNDYFYKKRKNGLNFFIYREEENTFLSAFAHDEQMCSYEDAYSFILGLLGETFSIDKVRTEPNEITMSDFNDCLVESKRREYMCPAGKVAETSKVWLYHYYPDIREQIKFEFSERIVPEKCNSTLSIYDRDFVKELSSIETSGGNAELSGNPVHYIISSRSMEAAKDMVQILMQKLYDAKRITSRRMEIITEIDPEVFKGLSHLEEIIENNFGGVIVFDLSEKLGKSTTSYGIAAKYIENLLKQYRNKCLFVFTYNMDKPGFSYALLPKLQNYVIPVTLREGKGDRTCAVEYLTELIQNSEYAKYASQAAEYLKLFPGDEFTQTDVLSAFEQFGAWAINKNVLHAYNFDPTNGFMLDRSENEESPYDKLQNLIGLTSVKKHIDRIIANDLVEKERKKRIGKKAQSSSMHMIFAGNPGSAKTTVAELFAGIAKEKNILKSGAFVVRGGMDLAGAFCVPAIRDAFDAAKGGVLFIDEAYAVQDSGNRDIAIATLIQEMENRRDEVIVILAGYGDLMNEFLELNDGLKSRIPHWVDFPDYSTEELTEIFRKMVDERGFQVTDDAVQQATYLFEKARHMENYGNGRYVRNLLEHALQNQAVRLLANGKDAADIKKKQLALLIKDDITALDDDLQEEREPGTAMKELDSMIGLTSVKKIIHKAIANYKYSKMCLEKGIAKENVSLHMVFTGNPGTAKTTVARLFAEILKDEKVLPTGKFVEVGRADLVGMAVGHTAPKVRKKFREAQGGVLFIDEAYSLCDAKEESFGDEAITTIVQEMENHRDEVIVIFAGYPEPMKEFLDRNPGMRSRIAFEINFEDYSTEELCDIAKLMLENKKMRATEGAMKKLKKNFEAVCVDSDFGNGRFVRATLEEAQMNLAERLLGISDSEMTTELITTLEEGDIPAFVPAKKTSKVKLGFV